MNGNKYKILIIEDDEHINNLCDFCRKRQESFLIISKKY